MVCTNLIFCIRYAIIKLVWFSTILATIGGYGFGRSRYDFKFRGTLFSLLLFALMLPRQIMYIPQFVMMARYGLLNTRWSLVLLYTALQLPVSTYLMATYFSQLPSEMEDAARIDGCNDWRMFWQVMLPLARPALATIVLINFMVFWKELLLAVTQDCWNLRGMAQFFEDMALNREFAEGLLDRVLAIHIASWEHFLDAVGEYVDMVETADDLGSQRGLLISPRMYRDLIKPRHAALNAAIRARTRAKIFFHSCGAIMPLIDDFIDSGVDVLNPIQPLPGLMDPEELKARYGGRLIFHGGLDVQSLLLTGTPDEVRAEVRRYLDVLGPESYIMAPANSVQPGTPSENLVAAYEAARNHSLIRQANGLEV